MSASSRRLRVLTWHVHGNYMYYLSQVPHDFYLAFDAARSQHHSGRSGSLPWGSNVHEVPVEAIAGQTFDAVLYQSRDAWESDRLVWLSAEQRTLPAIALEHDPPLSHASDCRHWADGANTLIVHVTHYNALMWDNGATPSCVVEHGVRPLRPARYGGERPSGIAVVNNLDMRGRRAGLDVFLEARQQVPIDLVGMGSLRLGGEGEVPNADLAAHIAQYRFYFHPLRYTSLGLSAIEAMLTGIPLVGLATTELPSVVRDGIEGFVDTRLERLVDSMRLLLREPKLAREIGEAGRRVAAERFSIGRFSDDWCRVLQRVCG